MKVAKLVETRVHNMLAENFNYAGKFLVVSLFGSRQDNDVWAFITGVVHFT